MRKTMILLCFAIGFIAQISAQDKVYERRGSGIFIELFGHGVLYSINYESRFSNKNRGLGGRVGIAYLDQVADKKTIVAPLMLNYLLGKPEGKHFLELGAGVSLMSTEGLKVGSNGEDVYFRSKAYGALSIMYCRHPPFGGFLFKIGFTPFFGKFEGANGYLGSFGISLGYAI